jgi:N-acetylglucosamine-6-phosphate deacetylase
MQMHRHDNIVQRVLSHDGLRWTCFIADGAHVAFPALKNYIRARGIDKCIVVTDAVAPAGLGPGRYKVSRWDLVIGDDLVGRAPDGSHLIGSAVSMRRQVQNLKTHLGLTDEQCKKLTVDNPHTAISPSPREGRGQG